MNTVYYEEEKETSVSAGEAFRGLLPLLRPHLRRLTINLLLMLTATATAVVGPVLIQQAIDTAIASVEVRGQSFGELPLIGIIHAEPAQITETAAQIVWVLALLYLLALIITTLSEYLQRVHLEIVGQDVIAELKKRCFNHLTRLSISFFDRNPVGRLLSRVESDGESLRRLFANIVVMLLRDVLMLAGMLTAMLIYSWKLTLVVLSLTPLMVGLVYLYQRYTSSRFLEVRKRMADIIAGITEFLQGMSILQVFNRQKWAQDRMRDYSRRKFQMDAATHIANVVFFNLVMFFESVLIALVIFFGSRLVAGPTAVGAAVAGVGEGATAGVLMAFIMYIRRFFEPLHRASEEMHVIQQAVAGARRVFALLSNREIIPEPLQPQPWQGFEKAIRFESVSFSYTGDEHFALRDVSFEINKGERVALVGVTGGGKSTIANLLLRFYDVTSGRITIDGIDIRDIAIQDLRSKYGLVLQDIFLFPGNIRDNITLERESISEELLHSTARLAAAERFIQKLPQQYDTDVAERGGNLSRGERQLLSFARAMIFNPQILVLDEATSSVDPDTERRIQVALKRLLKGRTSLVIAHRLSTILDADKILVIREGQIIEQGTHRELLSKGGYYEKLFRLQFMEQEEASVA